MGYASFVVKGIAQDVRMNYIYVKVNNRTIKLYGQDLYNKCRAGDYIVCDGFIDSDKNYIKNLEVTKTSSGSIYQRIDHDNPSK